MNDMTPLDGKALPEALSLEAITTLPNVAEELSPSEVARIGQLVVGEYNIDRDSMKDWLKRMDAGLDLAALVKSDKDYPWPKAANVKYPLVTTAALQFNAKAYPAVVPSDQVVQAKVWGSDPRGEKAARGERVAQHMSYQLLCKIEEWEEGTDKLLTLLPIVGTVVRKVWWDPAQQRIRCRMITPGDFVVHDKTKSMDDAPRLTERLSLHPSEIEERVRSGEWIGQDYCEENAQDTQAAESFLEQHRRLDLDGDGYEEPYICTVHEGTGKVARIVADFDMQDVVRGPGKPIVGANGMGEVPGRITAIRRSSYFVPYHFLPSLTGGFFSTGFGLLLADISETINTIINQMLDAGHAASLGGGFIGAEWRIKGGAQRMRPGEWRLVNTTGQSVRDAMVPITYPGPSDVLFQLLGLLIEAGKEVASIKDVLMGETGGKAMTATTTLALIEQGMAQFTAAYKRIFRSLKQEYRLIARINARTLTPEEYNAFHDTMEAVPGPDGQPTPQPVMHDPARDYGAQDMDITPVADPQSVTRMQEAAKAQLLMEMAGNGLVNPQAASKRMLEAAAIGDVEELAPQPDPMAQAMAQAEIAEKMGKAQQAQAGAQQGQLEARQMLLDANAKAVEVQQAQQELALERAKFMAEQQQAAFEASLKAKTTEADARLKEAQTAKTYAEIGVVQHDAALADRQQGLAERSQELSERQAAADVALRGEEMGLKRAAQSDAARRTDADISHRGQELGLKGREVEQAGERDRVEAESRKAETEVKKSARKPAG